MKGRILVFFISIALCVLSVSSIYRPQANSNTQGNTQNKVTDRVLDIEETDFQRLPILENVQASGPGDLVYAADNQSMGQNIMIFRRDDKGALTRLKMVPTGGNGLFDIVGFNRAPTGVFAATDIGPWEHDQNLVMNADRSRMFVVNQGSDTISVLDVSADGLTLTPVPGSPFKTGHIPSSIGVAGDTIIVVNKNDDPGGQKKPGQHASIQTFKMAANGTLTDVQGSLIELPGARCGEGVFCDQTTTPSQALVSPDGKLVFVNDFFAGMIRPFVIQPDGTLKATKPFDIRSMGFDVLPANGQTFPFSLGLGIVPGTNVLYTGLLFENKVGVFTFNPKNGKLKFKGTALNGGSTLCWFAISKSGRFMWTSNQASNSVSTYDLSDPLKPVETQVINFKTCGETQQVALSPDGKWIHYIATAVTNKCSQKDPDTRSNMIHTLQIGSDGLMTELTPPDVMTFLPLGERIQGVVTK